MHQSTLHGDLGGHVLALVQQAQAGYADALGEALGACRQYLLWVAHARLNPNLRAKGGASDLVQQVCLDAHRNIHGFRGTSPAEVIGWLNRLLLNRLAKFDRAYRTSKRDARREVSLDVAVSDNRGGAVPCPDESPSDVALAAERAELIRRELARLPDTFRRVIELRHRDQMSFEEIARRLKRTEGAVRRAWARGLEHLRRELDVSDAGTA